MTDKPELTASVQHTEDAAAATGLDSPSNSAEFTASEGYKRYVIWLLFAVYVFNFLDRQIFTTLLQPIKQEFQFSDTQMGLLGGLAFALFYSTLGIPIARLADQRSRVNIIAFSIAIWSAATAFTGFAKTFSHLLIARICVGVGEAGCSPPAYSLISDYFAPEKRARAMSIYSMGIGGGVFLGFLVSGAVAEQYGWRAAFFVVGLPGVLLALLLKLTLREPPRGFSDNISVAAKAPPVGEALTALWRRRSFRHLSLAAALHAFAGYGVGSFVPAFLIRSHGMTVAEVGFALSMISAVGIMGGIYLGGYLSDRIACKRDDERYYMLVPAIATILAVPIALCIYLLPSKVLILTLILPSQLLGYMYLGPTFTMTQSLAGIRERALAGAVLLLIINLIGLGLGPTLAGWLSDMFRISLAAGGMEENFATAQGLRYALCAVTLVNVWSAFHYVMAARSLREDLADVKNEQKMAASARDAA
ncbi:MFS transporter [Congregibacter variabilis]|uniref:MFS transporter n=1 Tax=Congregibacter variabilis TaxID=3081200 RepID=A0ABZ0HZ58_9GAMM|nr:MFS transporter [Congregibacter sp. IMCC43200]